MTLFMPKREIISHDSEDRFLSGVVSIQDQDITDRSWKVYAQVYIHRKLGRMRAIKRREL